MSDNDRSPDAEVAVPAEKIPERSGGLLAALRSAFGVRQNGSVRAEIEEAIAADEAEGADFSPEERSMLRAVLRLGDMRVDEVMVPRSDIEAVDAKSSVAEILALVRTEGHSRLPVYRDNLDDPIGMVHIKDVMSWIAEIALQGTADGAPARFELGGVDLGKTLEEARLIRSVLFVPPSMPARLLLQRMQASRTQMALVIDEYGGTDGLVSLEDLIEVIVGEIEDEHDLDEAPAILKVGDGVFVADARAFVEDARAVIGDGFKAAEDAEEVETVGGLVFAAMGRVPVRGEIVDAVPGFEFEILDADPRRIKRLRIRDRSRMKAPTRQRTRAQAQAEASLVPGTDGRQGPA